jgi:hypothetical protein
VNENNKFFVFRHVFDFCAQNSVLKKNNYFYKRKIRNFEKYLKNIKKNDDKYIENNINNNKNYNNNSKKNVLNIILKSLQIKHGTITGKKLFLNLKKM